MQPVGHRLDMPARCGNIINNRKIKFYIFMELTLYWRTISCIEFQIAMLYEEVIYVYIYM